MEDNAQFKFERTYYLKGFLITWDQTLFSFLFVNNIPVGKAKQKRDLAGLHKREYMRQIEPDFRLAL